ncbi:MAG: C4-type zinc ribbon domain-containing protein [Candidatus Eiseniibacteriota bacterium]|jgi:predicted  nucleic acid-binding Zn-ribbon protein
MQQQLLLLVALQDVDEMIREASDAEHASKMEGYGFKVTDVEALKASRARLVEQIEPRHLALYERVAKRFGRAVVPVQGQVCLGCFMSLPTQHIGVAKNDGNRIETCENCGRILYWL